MDSREERKHFEYFESFGEFFPNCSHIEAFRLELVAEAVVFQSSASRRRPNRQTMTTTNPTELRKAGLTSDRDTTRCRPPLLSLQPTYYQHNLIYFLRPLKSVTMNTSATYLVRNNVYRVCFWARTINGQ